MLEGPGEEASKTGAAQEGKPAGQQQTLPLWLESARKPVAFPVWAQLLKEVLHTSCLCWPCLEPQYQGGWHREMV